MTDTPPPPDPTRTLGQFALGALGLIVVAALLFLLIGAVSGDDGGEPVASPSTTAPTTSAPSTPATTTPSTEPTPTSTGDTTTAPPASPSPSASPTLAIDPASVSVQVLDGVLDDNGATADEVANELETAGYRVIAQNRAVRSYDQTTVFYTDGNEAAARQIADTFGYDVVGQAPANLNQSVAIHIVVGADA